MAKVYFNRHEVEKHITLDERNLEMIRMLGISLELTKDSLEIEVLANRPDILSFQGFLRAFKAFTGKEPGLKKYKVLDNKEKLIVEKSLPKEWPYAYACIVKGLSFNNEKIKEIINIQEKLGATLLRNRKKGGIGLYPLEKIKFPIKFKGLAPEKIIFRPLEYPEAINSRQILSKHPTGKAYAHIMEEWQTFPVFIDAKGSIMSMPPIINSHDIGKIDEKTKDIFIETTGTDARILKKALIIIVTALADMGGKIYSLQCTQQNGKKEKIPDLSPEKMKISLQNVNSLLSLDLKEKDFEKLLPKMGYEYKKGKVSIPAWRTDILHEVDIIEDIAIAYGYDNIEPKLPEIATIAQENKEEKIKNKIAEILSGLELIETSSYHLIKKDEAEKINLSESEIIEVENSKTDYKILRQNLLIPALRIFAENKDAEYPQKIFELGIVFSKNESVETGTSEEEHLIIACSPANFTEMKQILDYLTRSLDIKYELKESQIKGLIDGRTGEIIINNKSIGYMGEIHPDTLREFNIKMPLSIIEISLEEIFSLLNI